MPGLIMEKIQYTCNIHTNCSPGKTFGLSRSEMTTYILFTTLLLGKVVFMISIVLFRTVVQLARAEAMGVGLKHSTNNRSYVNC